MTEGGGLKSVKCSQEGGGEQKLKNAWLKSWEKVGESERRGVGLALTETTGGRARRVSREGGQRMLLEKAPAWLEAAGETSI